MGKPLSEMSNEELWAIFPIVLEEYNPLWKVRYKAEEAVLKQALGAGIVRVHHFGSTSVEGLLAKPTIDILMEIREGADLEKLKKTICSLGYIFTPQPGNPPPHMMFMKGYTTEGFQGQAFHLHVRYPGDWQELYFRDYLREHPDSAEQYRKLKKQLQKEFTHDRDGYTAAKTEFIREVTERAKNLYKGRYQINRGI